jgi:hypothetical protein
MAKFKPGIPDTFNLDVTPVQDLGDYLDEPPPSPRPKARVVEKEVPAPQAPIVETAPPAAVRTPAPQPVTPPVAATGESKPAVAPEPPRESVVVPTAAPESVVARNDDEREERGGRPKAPRREISMTPETLRMSDELLDIIRSGSGQRDTKANELFHALVLLVHEVKDEIDVHSIPKRGRWGTPTARAYPVELKNAFLKALLKRYGERDAIELRYEVGSAA